jgi:hypothetical protein
VTLFSTLPNMGNISSKTLLLWTIWAWQHYPIKTVYIFLSLACASHALKLRLAKKPKYIYNIRYVGDVPSICQSNSDTPFTVRLKHQLLALCLSDIFLSPPLLSRAFLVREKQRERERDFHEGGGEDGLEF